MTNPYSNLPEKAFWRLAVAEKTAFRISDVWQPKHPFNKSHKIATAGSCFAQHISNALLARGYTWMDEEPAPDLFDPSVKKKYSYGIFSFRTGNIYTVAAFKQWILWALGKESPPQEYWEKDGRYFDPFRPTVVEPDGLASVEDLLASRESTLKAIKRVINRSGRFIFTLGLTEAWVHREHQYVYAICPGVQAGTFDPATHEFKNFTYSEIRKGLGIALNLIKQRNKGVKFLLTVSPVPLTATASGQHVLTATTHSKSVLRAVAGEMSATRVDTDYFPSYELINGAPFRGMFFERNMRAVAPEGVAFVMNSFFSCLEAARDDAVLEATNVTQAGPSPRRHSSDVEQDVVVCDEALLDAFGGG